MNRKLKSGAAALALIWAVPVPVPVQASGVQMSQRDQLFFQITNLEWDIVANWQGWGPNDESNYTAASWQQMIDALHAARNFMATDWQIHFSVDQLQNLSNILSAGINGLVPIGTNAPTPAPTPPPAPAPTPPSTETRTGQTTAPLNFRRGPGTNHAWIRTLAVGQTVTILSESGGWMNVQVGQETGWVSADWIRVTGTAAPTPTPPSTETRTGQTTAGLNFRQGPGTGHSLIRTLPVGQALTILSQSGDWMNVQVGQQTGWVNAQWVQLTANAAPTPPPPPPAAPTPAPARTGQTTAALNFRQGPGTGHTLIRTLAVGQTVTILRESGGWMNVQVGQETGWVSAQWVQTAASSAPSAPAARTGQTTAALNFRQGPGTNHSLIRTLALGQTVTILSESNGWMNVQIGQETGWVSAQWVRAN